MKYIQITAGRGPVECARVVTLITQKLSKNIPSLQLIACEPHNQFKECYMSITLKAEEPIQQSIVNEWQGTIQWHSTHNPYRPSHKRSNWFVGISFFDEIELPQITETDIRY